MDSQPSPNLPPTLSPAPTPKTSGLAITSLVLGITSFFCFGFLTGIPAIILGIVALNKIPKSGGTQTGRGLAIAGLTTGCVGLIFGTALLAGMLLPALSAAREKARTAVCFTHVKTLGLAIALYANEHDGKIPQTFEDLAAYAGGEETLRKQLVCPSAQDQSHSSYELLQGGKAWQSDAEAIVIREIERNHHGGRIVLFGDAHAEFTRD